MSRLFVAVWPPDDVVAELALLRRKDQRGVRFVPPESWHVTLRFLGECPVDAAVAALDGVVLPSATARLGPGVDVLGDRALVVPVQGLDELAGAVRAATRDLGQADGRHFVGHLTLARLRRGVHLPPAMGALVQASWTVGEVTLVQSRLDPERARYTVLHTRPLG